jgi:hypothetical protein
METTSRYWQLCQVSLTRARAGYETRSLPLAQAFLQDQASTALQAIQATLLSQFRSKQPEITPTHRAQAGLCLRCYISHPILKACQTIAHLFSGDHQFTYHDLLPFVLNDDGKALIVLDQDGKTHLKLEDAGTPQPTAFKIFAVEVLRTFKSDSATSMSLGNWAFLQTKRYPELKAFLSEFGFQHLSDWALLNRVRPKQIEQLAARDRHLVEAFHTVYRRDRRQQRGHSKCLDPTIAQLTEMQRLLEVAGLPRITPDEILKALKQVAQQLRQYDIWSHRTPLEVQNPESGHYELRHDLPTDDHDEFDGEQQEFLEFLQQQLPLALANAVEQGIAAHRVQLEKSRKYAPFAASFVVGLQRYYCEGLSLREIGPQLGMSSWDQTRRILNPGDLLTQVRRLTVQQVFDQILNKAQALGLASTPPEPSYLKTLSEQLEAFVDAEIFAEAATEIKAGKHRSLNSIYAQHLKRYFEQHLLGGSKS